ncbi:hypothetical protein LCGC14_0736110 [marine sediment metagenome]|uniref:Uncharacterized protein n=1 Tax=marine sediment metagenome TaxID=412755 RepID=A0A0F9QCC0_9ZZZZ
MNLDIEALRLTWDELQPLVRLDTTNALYEPDPHAVADAQLAKALWGFYDWLEIWPKSALRDALEQANIERPSAARAETGLEADDTYYKATVKGDSPDQWETFSIDGVRYLNGERVTE